MFSHTLFSFFFNTIFFLKQLSDISNAEVSRFGGVTDPYEILLKTTNLLPSKVHICTHRELIPCFQRLSILLKHIRKLSKTI